MHGCHRLAAIAGLSAFIAAAHAADWTHAERVAVITSDFGFTPQTLYLEPDTTYHLRFENLGREPHTINARVFFAAVMMRDKRAVQRPAEIRLDAQQVLDVDILTKRPGHYPLADPARPGIAGEIVIE